MDGLDALERIAALRDEENELEPLITGTDSTPVPRRRETQIQLERRVSEAELKAFGRDRPLMTDEQVDSLVNRISELVTEAVLERVHKDSAAIVRGHMGEVLKDLAFRTKLST